MNDVILLKLLQTKHAVTSACLRLLFKYKVQQQTNFLWVDIQVKTTIAIVKNQWIFLNNIRRLLSTREKLELSAFTTHSVRMYYKNTIKPFFWTINVPFFILL